MKIHLIYFFIGSFCLLPSLNAQNAIKLPQSPVEYFKINGEDFVKRDFSNYIDSYADHLNPEVYKNKEEITWLHYLNAAHPSISTLENYFQEAANTYNIPIDLLQAIAYVESNWTQVGPSLDQRWGIMRLASNNYCQSLEAAAQLIGKTSVDLKNNPRLNILGAAALINHIRAQENIVPIELIDWFEIIKKFSGHIDELTREMAAESYFKILQEGIHTQSLWGEEYYLQAHTIDYEHLCTTIKKSEEQTKKLSSSNKDSFQNWHAGINQQILTNNFSSRKNTDIDVWVNHWFGVGTWAGAISWFKDPASQVSSHFLVRNDGYIVQMVAIEDKAWHASLFNSRSIGIEHHATIDHPEYWQSTAMLQKSAMLAIDYCKDCAIPKVRKFKVYEPGIYGHTDIPTINKDCPGPMPWDTWLDLIGSEAGNNDTQLLDNFDVNMGHINADIGYSGSTQGIDVVNSTKYRSTISPKLGSGALKINLQDDSSSDSKWLVRLLSGYGKPQNNLSFPKKGKLEFWLKASPDVENIAICFWLDDSDGVEASANKSIIADDSYHKYIWDLSDEVFAVTGNGQINAENLTIDAIVIQAPNQSANISIYIDEIRYYPANTNVDTEEFTDNKGKSIKQLQLYPNPLQNQLNIKFSTENNKETRINIFDLQGRAVYSRQSIFNQGDQHLFINTSHLRTGIYLIQLSNDQEVLSRKFRKR